jgi:DNA-binding HxlR family transcriptional regulator
LSRTVIHDSVEIVTFRRYPMIIDGRECVVKMGGKSFHCAMDITMDYVGGKWKTVVLWYLKNGKKRFGELNRLIPQITEKMLSIQLKQLEKSGLVSRKVYPEVPLRVEYGLTPLGKSLIPVLDAIAKWGRMMSDSRGKTVEVGREKV